MKPMFEEVRFSISSQETAGDHLFPDGEDLLESVRARWQQEIRGSDRKPDQSDRSRHMPRPVRYIFALPPRARMRRNVRNSSNLLSKNSRQGSEEIFLPTEESKSLEEAVVDMLKEQEYDTFSGRILYRRCDRRKDRKCAWGFPGFRPWLMLLIATVPRENAWE